MNIEAEVWYDNFDRRKCFPEVLIMKNKRDEIVTLDDELLNKVPGGNTPYGNNNTLYKNNCSPGQNENGNDWVIYDSNEL